MTMLVSACARISLSMDNEGESKVVSIDRYGVLDKGCRRPYWVLRVIGIDCLWMTRGKQK